MIDPASPIKSSCCNSKRDKRRLLWRLALSIVILLLFAFACFNLTIYKEQKPSEPLLPSSIAPKTIESDIPKTEGPVIEKKSISVSSGDTLIELLVKGGMERINANSVITELKKVFNPRLLRKGQEITLAFEISDNGDYIFHSLSIRLDMTKEIRVTRSSEDSFTSKEILYKLDAKPVRSAAEISSSLYDAAIEAGMPVEVLIQMIRAYSYDVDFQRDIRPGDKFEALYEKMYDGNGNFVEGGSILYTLLKTNGRTMPIYRYKTTDGEVDFYDENGKSVRKTLMVTPVNGARLSSGYGMRRHPILGYSRMHKGLDFAAPIGTPIMAAGDGVVEYAGRKGGYGKYIRIRHANHYMTAYGHMRRFASGIRKGVRVKQGETIGYVGSTGLSTGPHLHYEILHNGKSINPSSVRTPSCRTLKGKELEKFFMAKNELKALYVSLGKKEKLAGN